MADATLTIGFLPLVDACLPILAHEHGFAADEGVALTFVRDVSWATVLDRLLYGPTDGAHMLAPLTIAQFAYQSEKQRAALLVQYQQYLTVDQPQHFDAQAAWWLQQLATSTDPALTILADTLQQRQDRLESLQQTLAELKQGD